MKEIITRLKSMLKWSDRIGSDEIVEINEVITSLENIKIYSNSDMEKSFIAGGKANRDINNPSFDEFLETLNK